MISGDALKYRNGALPEESRRTNNFQPLMGSSHNLPPHLPGGRSINFEVPTAVKVTFQIEFLLD